VSHLYVNIRTLLRVTTYLTGSIRWLLYCVVRNKNYYIHCLLHSGHSYIGISPKLSWQSTFFIGLLWQGLFGLSQFNILFIIFTIFTVHNNVYITLLGSCFSTHYSSKPILFHIYFILLLIPQRAIHF